MMSECFLVFERSNRTVVRTVVVTVVISSIWVFYLYLEEDDDRCRELWASWNLLVQLIAVYCLLWQGIPIPLPSYSIYHSSILSNNSTIVQSSNALHLWIRLTLYQRIFLPVDVTEPWSGLFFNHWFCIGQLLSDVNSFCFWCSCHSFLRSSASELHQSLAFGLQKCYLQHAKIKLLMNSDTLSELVLTGFSATIHCASAWILTCNSAH